MAVYRRGYQRYQGAMTSHWERMLVMPRFAWARIAEQRIVTTLLVVAMFWPLLCALFIYMANNLDMLQGFGDGLKKFLAINGTFFLTFMKVQSIAGLVLAAVAGPGLVAPDLSNNALPLYFSRPLTRTDYIVSRMLVLVAMMSAVTVVPGVLLFAMQAGMAGGEWLGRSWYLGFSVVVGFAVDIVIVSLVAMTSSAYVKWRVVAGALVLGFFFVMAGAAEIVNEVFRVEWASTFNPWYAIDAVWRGLLDLEIPDDKPGVFECAVYLGALGTGLAGLLARKLRPVEVVK